MNKKIILSLFLCANFLIGKGQNSDQNMNAQIPVLKAELLLDTQSELGEGSIWDYKAQVLHWVDIEGKLLHTYDPASGTNKSYPMPSRIGTVVPSDDGQLVVALQDGIYTFDPKTAQLSLIVNPVQDEDIRFNDGKCDPSGRLWAGTMPMRGPNKGKLYRMDNPNSIQVMIDSVSISNGIVWTADKKTMYYNDTPTRCVQAFDYDDATGHITNQRIAITFGPGDGGPDGMTIDADDNLWIALWGSGTVKKYNPATGEHLLTIEVGAANVTSCAFGGKDLDILYITTARAWTSDEKLKTYPNAGGLFSVRPGAKGVKAFYYKEN